jgi:hypothetical protein
MRARKPFLDWLRRFSELITLQEEIEAEIKRMRKEGWEEESQ